MKHTDKDLKNCPTNHLKQCQNPHYVEVWVDGKRFVAEWKQVNRALIDPDCRAQLREVPWSRVQRGDATTVQSYSAGSENIDERAAEILTLAAEEAQRRIKEMFPDK
jgi:hypothetical protein